MGVIHDHDESSGKEDERVSSSQGFVWKSREYGLQRVMHGQIRGFAEAVKRGHEDARVRGRAGARTRGRAGARMRGRRGARTRGRGREEEFVRKSCGTHEDLRSGSFGCWWKSMKKNKIGKYCDYIPGHYEVCERKVRGRGKGKTEVVWEGGTRKDFLDVPKKIIDHFLRLRLKMYE